MLGLPLNPEERSNTFCQNVEHGITTQKTILSVRSVPFLISSVLKRKLLDTTVLKDK
jgi:hypothetical protein